MHKLKKTADSLRNYLGRDERGIDLLDQVVQVANDLHKLLATEKERSEKAMLSKEMSEAISRHAEREISELRSELSQLRVLKQQRERDVQTWKNVADGLQNKLEGMNEDSDLIQKWSDDLLDYREFRSALKALRSKLRIAPKPSRMIMMQGIQQDSNGVIRDRYATHELNNIVPNLSPTHMMTLGRFVAVLALCNLPCIIEAKKTLQMCDSWDPDTEAITEIFIPWFRKNIDFSGSQTMCFNNWSKVHISDHGGRR